MVIIFPLMHLCILVVLLKKQLQWRLAGAYAAVICGAEVVVLTESLSLFGLLEAGRVAGAWIVLTILLAGWATYIGAWPRRRDLGLSLPATVFDRTMIVGLVLLTGVSLLVAVIAPPNNYDSLTYHMSRVAHWAHQQSVAHYPTHILRQLHQNPFAEFVILQFHLLAEGDRFANLVQWGSWVGAIIVASLLAKELGAGTRGQIWSAVFAGTLPMAVLQATNTQNDLVLAFLLLLMALFIVRILRSGRLPVAEFIAAGVAMGLAVLTKGTAYVFAAPWLLLLVGTALAKWRLRSLLPLAVAGLLIVALNAGHWQRNFRTYGSILGVKVEHGTRHDYTYSNDHFSPGTLLSNVLRNTALQLVSKDLSTARPVEGAVRAIHRWFGLDAEDPRTTWAGEPFMLRDAGWNEIDFAGNPIHLLLVLGCGVAAVWRFRRSRRSLTTLVGGMVLAGYLLFCLYLRWQPWHGRLHTPLFMLLAAAVGIGLSSVRWRVVSWALAAILFFGAGWRILDNRVHPLRGDRSVFVLPRRDQYLAMSPGLLDPFRAFASAIERSDIDAIGLISNNDEPEYLLWVFGRLRCVKHVEVHNVSGGVPPDKCSPSVVFLLKIDQGIFGFAPRSFGKTPR